VEWTALTKPSKRTPETPRLLRMAPPFYAQEALRSAAVYGGVIALDRAASECGAQPTQCSLLHAEMVAIALAQKALGRYDLGDGGKFNCELVTSTEPCAMCFGAVPWSGVTRLVCAARDEDARAIGFDEGAKLPDWQLALEQRGITVTRDLLRADAVSILQEYASKGGLIYNGLAQGTTKV
jgi:tRNA(Arg) A34 adenosine deaminase TadA